MIRRMYFDIETGSVDPEINSVFPEPRIARHNIISIVAYCNYNEKYYVFIYREDLSVKQEKQTRELLDGPQEIVYYQTDTEEDMLLAFAKFWGNKQFDVIHAWNGDNFDIPYLLTRLNKLGIYNQFMRKIAPEDVKINYNYTDIPGAKSFDLMRGAKKILGRYAPGSLQAVSMLKLGVGKLGETVSAVAAWRYDLDRLIDYNIRDVELMVKLDEKIPIFSFFRTQVEMTGSDYIDTLLANYKVCEQFIRYHKSAHPFLDDFMIENVSHDVQKAFEGAIVLETEAGDQYLIAVHDLAMMYPNIMLSCNMSPETIVKRQDYTDEEWEKMDPVFVDGIYFRTDFVGFIPTLIKIQVELRYEIERNANEFAKKFGEGFEKTEQFETFMQMRMNIKGLINSWFGVFGYKGFMLYDFIIAKCVTYLGVKQIEWSRDFVKDEYGLDTKYGDTDSIFIETPGHIAAYEKIKRVMDLIYSISIGEQISPTYHSSIDDEIERLKQTIVQDLEIIADYHEKVGDAITESYDEFAMQYNIKNHSFSMKFEKLYAGIFFSKPKNAPPNSKKAAKKRYAGLLVYKDGKPVWTMDVTGFQVKRSDTAQITIDCQNDVLRAIVLSKDTYKNVHRIMRKYYLKALKGGVPPQYIGVPKGFGKPLRAYNKADRTYRWYAAQWSNENLGTNYGKGDKPKGVSLRYIPAPWNQFPINKKHKFNWIAFSDDHPLKDEFIEVIDWKHMSELTIIEPMRSIFESVDVKSSQIKSGTLKANVKRGF